MKAKKKSIWIMGKNCIREVLKAAPERIIKLYSSKDQSDQLLKEAKALGFVAEKKSKEVLDQILQSDSHQGFAAKLEEKEPLSLEQFLESVANKEASFVLALDSIFDPQNLGAILRAAECFGVDAVLWSKNRGASLSPSARKASVGASELVPCISVSNLSESIKAFQKAGFWSVATACEEGSSDLYSFEFPQKTILILGSEGKGLQNLILKKADFKLFIPMEGQIDSLNVAQATAVLLATWRVLKKNSH